MRIISFNVNGLNSCMNKGLMEFLSNIDFDVLCLQEIKCADELLELEGYHSFYNCYGNGGYSGTAILTKKRPISVNYKINNSKMNLEGRIITLEYKNFYLVNVYVPNSKGSKIRENYRMNFDEDFYNYLKALDCKKPVIVCGDFNVDINYNNAENFFDDCECDSFMDFLDEGFIDTFKELHPDCNKYTWYLNNNNNIGYRLDYFIVSEYFFQYLNRSDICENITCSDHLPIILELEYKLE